MVISIATPPPVMLPLLSLSAAVLVFQYFHPLSMIILPPVRRLPSGRWTWTMDASSTYTNRQERILTLHIFFTRYSLSIGRPWSYVIVLIFCGSVRVRD